MLSNIQFKQVVQLSAEQHLFIEEDERKHRSTQAPLIGAVLKQSNLKQCRQNVWEQLWPLPQMLANCLRRAL